MLWNERRNKKFKDLIKFIENFCLFIKLFYLTAWNVEKNTEINNLKIAWTKNRRIMLLSNCVVCDSKNSKFIKDQEASGLLSSLEIKTPLNETPSLDHLLF